MKKYDNNRSQRIEVGKMSFVIENEQPDNVTDEVRRNIEQELFNVFKKYENDDN